MKIFIRIIIVSLILSIASYVIIQVPSVQDRLMLFIASSLMDADNNLPTEDSLSVAVCGSRSPIPSPGRAETCMLVTAGENMFVLDIGDGSFDNLQSWNIPLGKVNAVLLTHLHSDHIADLPSLHQAHWIMQSRKNKLKVYGPEGVSLVTEGFEKAYERDYQFRHEHHGEEIATKQYAGFDPVTIDLNSPVIFDDDELRITAFRVIHEPVKPALGFKFEYKGRSVVFSGDTSYVQEVIDQSMNVDILFHEAQANHMVSFMQGLASKNGLTLRAKVMEDIKTYHTTLTEAAQIANKANVKRLVFYHLTPAPRNYITKLIFTRGVDQIRDDWVLGEEDMLFVLPVGSSDILQRKM